MEELKASSLDSEEIERLCEIAEEAARHHITSKVSWRNISDLDITVEAGEKEDCLTINVDVEVRLSTLVKNVDVKKLVQGAVDAAFDSVEGFMREDRCRSRK